MRIIFTDHALKKFKDLSILGFKVSKTQINKVLLDPLQLDYETDYPKIIASGVYDEKHVLRIVYRPENGKIIVITFYPARKERYLKS